MTTDYRILEIDKLTYDELMTEIQKGLDSVESGDFRTFAEVKDGVLSAPSIPATPEKDTQ